MPEPLKIDWETLGEGIFLPNSEATRTVGQWLGHHVDPNQVITISGDLGDGKTTLAKGIAEGWGVETTVKSPTYHYFITYRGKRGLLVHLDAYRLSQPDEYDSLLIEELLEKPWLLLVEWPANAGAHLPTPAIDLRIGPTPDGGRLLERILTPPRFQHPIEKDE